MSSLLNCIRRGGELAAVVQNVMGHRCWQSRSVYFYLICDPQLALDFEGRLYRFHGGTDFSTDESCLPQRGQVCRPSAAKNFASQHEHTK
jgi:hypothetical protein